ncbi:HlyD family secretion protein [Clostridium sp. DJ247]|uniref:HlyD family secretion protein n=1 Tax=Clostridium sp. DJ247 TaxID=2726188 RepID=UPI001F4C7F7B|nr:HlyD family efflux transporter periplasmic adaptor subunit [Clostridium sp. DJ247]
MKTEISKKEVRTLGNKKVFKPIILLILAGVIVSALFLINSMKNKNFNEFIYYGTAEADKINISAEIAGKIKDIKLKEGNVVKSGDLIATIDSNEDSLRLQDAETSIKNAENELAKIQEGNRAEEIKAQEAQVKQIQALIDQSKAALQTAQNNLSTAQTNYEYKKKKYDDTLKLYESGAESKYNVDAAKNDLDNTYSALNNAKSSVDSSQAQANSYIAQLNQVSQKLNLLVNGATEREKNTAQYSLEKSKNNYELSKLTLGKNNITASTGGVIETVNFKAGEYITPGSSVVTLLDNNNIWIKIYVPESILPKIKLDKEVSLKSDFLKDKNIKGKITYISPEAEFTPMNIVTKKDRMKLVYEVKIKILDNLDVIKPGMLFDVNLK